MPNVQVVSLDPSPLFITAEEQADILAKREEMAVLRMVERKPMIIEIQRAVAAEFGIKIGDMFSSKRTRNIARPRQVAMYLARTMSGCKLALIGKHFGNRDHTTIMHGVTCITKLIAADADFGLRVDRIAAVIVAGNA